MREHDWLKLSDLITNEGHPSLGNKSALPKNQANAQGLDTDSTITSYAASSLAGERVPAQPQTDTRSDLAQIEANITKLIDDTRKRSAVRTPAYSHIAHTTSPKHVADIVVVDDDAETLLQRVAKAVSAQKSLSDRINFLTGKIEKLQATLGDLGTAFNTRNHNIETLTREKLRLAALKTKMEESAMLALESSQAWQQAAMQEISAHANAFAERDVLHMRAEKLRLEIEQQTAASTKKRHGWKQTAQAQIENPSRQLEELKQTESAQPSIRRNKRVKTKEQATQNAPDTLDRLGAIPNGIENESDELHSRLQQLEAMIRVLVDNNQSHRDASREANASPALPPSAENQAYPRLRDVIFVSLCSAAATLFLLLCLAFFIARNSIASTDYVVEQRPNNNRRRGDKEGGEQDAGPASLDTPVNRLLGGARLLVEKDRLAIVTGLSGLERNSYTEPFFKAFNAAVSDKSVPQSKQQQVNQAGTLVDNAENRDSEALFLRGQSDNNGNFGVVPDPIAPEQHSDPTPEAKPDEKMASKSSDWIPPPSSGAPTTVSERKIILQQEKRAAVHVGPFDAIGSVQLGTGYNDNLYLDSQAAGSWQIFVQPALKLNLERGRNVYSLGGSLKQSSYPDSTINNYLDRFLETRNWFDFGAHHKLDLGGGMSWAHNMFGQFPQQAFASAPQGIFAFQAPVQYHDRNVTAKYTYGALTAKGNLEFRLGYLQMRYDNYPDLYQPLSRNDATAGMTFYYRVQPKTKLLAEFNNVYSHYPYNPPPNSNTPMLDGSFRNYLLGVAWSGTAKTTGTIKLGYVQKDFVNPTQANGAPVAWASNVSAMTWHVGVDWEPFRYSKFSLYSNQNLLPSWSLGSTAINVKNTHVDWHHAWTGRIDSRLSFDIGSQAYLGSAPYLANNLQSYGAEVTYQMHRWLRLGLNYTYTQRQSTQSIWTGDQNVFMLNVMLTPP